MKSKNKLLDFADTLCNFIALNVVFLITCLPIFTIGTAITSLYYVMMKESRGEYGYLVRPYLSAFKENFVKSTRVFLIMSILTLIFSFNLIFWFSMQTLMGNVLAMIFFIGLTLILGTSLYVFPLLSQFENTVIQTIKNALGICFANLKSSGLLLIITLFVFFLGYFSGPIRILLILFGFAFTAYVKSFILEKVFSQYH
ncbi:MAG: DUF624 domain-containing protein [Pseudobutyrivibrio sp.]|nr:DUF624 domain-containing protein [Pseudobutyrivibrio sp.]